MATEVQLRTVLITALFLVSGWVLVVAVDASYGFPKNWAGNAAWIMTAWILITSALGWYLQRRDFKKKLEEAGITDES